MKCLYSDSPFAGPKYILVLYLYQQVENKRECFFFIEHFPWSKYKEMTFLF